MNVCGWWHPRFKDLKELWNKHFFHLFDVDLKSKLVLCMNMWRTIKNIWRTHKNIQTYLLGFKELGTNVLRLHFVMLANHDQNVCLVLDLVKVCLCVKLESSVLQDLLCKSAWLDWSRIRFDWSKLMQIVFLQNFPT